MSITTHASAADSALGLPNALVEVPRSSAARHAYSLSRSSRQPSTSRARQRRTVKGSGHVTSGIMRCCSWTFRMFTKHVGLDGYSPEIYAREQFHKITGRANIVQRPS